MMCMGLYYKDAVGSLPLPLFGFAGGEVAATWGLEFRLLRLVPGFGGCRVPVFGIQSRASSTVGF